MLVASLNIYSCAIDRSVEELYLEIIRRDDFRVPLSTPFMVKTIFFENLFNNMLRLTSLIVSQIATAIFLSPALSGLHLIKFFLIQR